MDSTHFGSQLLRSFTHSPVIFVGDNASAVYLHFVRYASYSTRNHSGRNRNIWWCKPNLQPADKATSWQILCYFLIAAFGMQMCSCTLNMCAPPKKEVKDWRPQKPQLTRGALATLTCVHLPSTWSTAMASSGTATLCTRTGKGESTEWSAALKTICVLSVLSCFHFTLSMSIAKLMCDTGLPWSLGGLQTCTIQKIV